MAEAIKDTEIGKKLRQIRNMLGISQAVLAQKSGVTFQQIQKYEKGINRISAVRLQDFARILGVDVMEFYKPSEPSAEARKVFNEGKSDVFEKQDIFTSKETITLLREYYKIKDASKRKNIVEIIKAMSENEG